jgi:hypothetical protein
LAGDPVKVDLRSLEMGGPIRVQVAVKDPALIYGETVVFFGLKSRKLRWVVEEDKQSKPDKQIVSSSKFDRHKDKDENNDEDADDLDEDNDHDPAFAELGVSLGFDYGKTGGKAGHKFTHTQIPTLNSELKMEPDQGPREMQDRKQKEVTEMQALEAKIEARAAELAPLMNIQVYGTGEKEKSLLPDQGLVNQGEFSMEIEFEQTQEEESLDPGVFSQTGKLNTHSEVMEDGMEGMGTQVINEDVNAATIMVRSPVKSKRSSKRLKNDGVKIQEKAEKRKEMKNTLTGNKFTVLHDVSDDNLLQVACDSKIVLGSDIQNAHEVLSIIRDKEIAQAVLAETRKRIEVEKELKKKKEEERKKGQMEEEHKTPTSNDKEVMIDRDSKKQRVKKKTGTESPTPLCPT